MKVSKWDQQHGNTAVGCRLTEGKEGKSVSGSLDCAFRSGLTF